ncbi:MAG: helicase-associated domain-containing protein [Myxococcota bacterium]|nr:helicase-associated domain-containing protein [Myxococcota bacterium]
MSEQAGADANNKNKRRRRRRRRSKSEGGGGEEQVQQQAQGEKSSSGGGRRRRRRDEDNSPAVSTPNTGRSRRRKRRRRKRRGPAVAGLNRRRKLSNEEIGELEDYFGRMPEGLLSKLYKGLGGQPTRVGDIDRMVQLSVRAIAKGKRLGSMLKGLHEKERMALAILIQCGGLAHSEELLRELHLSLGGHERDWTRVLLVLADKGLVNASEEQDGAFFYLVPDPLVEHLVEHLESELKVGVFQHDEIRVRNARAFVPPLDFSITTLCTYIDQRPPRLTQQQDIFKADKQEMDEFFGQLWDANSELFHFHIDFLIQHGLCELSGDRLAVNRDVVEEWLQLESEDQRDLIFRSLDQRFRYAEWILYAVHSGKGEWVPEQPLQALYRRWTRGEDWRKRFHKGEFAATRSHERESFSFAPLANAGMLELGEWGQEKFYRLTPRALAMIEPAEEGEFSQFYLTPSYEIMAPAGLPPMLLFHIGELAELTGCDRANTYKISEISIEQALAKGWRRDDVLEFLREGSQIGLPENVDQTLKSWMGSGVDVEFHDCVVMTVAKTKVKEIEAARSLRPHLLHRFAPGMYAIDRSRIAEVFEALSELGLSPAKDLRHYPGEPGQISAREALHQLLAEARETSDNPLARAHEADTQPEDLLPVPGSSTGRRKKKKKKPVEAPRLSPAEVRKVLDRAIALRQAVRVQYAGKDGKRVGYTLEPSRLALNPAGEQVVVARNAETGDLRTFKVGRIERVKAQA